ncbi:MAG: branched-chain amino acid ABC transporter permease, partial [Rhodospirillaceae bacterium]|nr:branched-chain amino acid ABC transporter permease [Rhodospirillaceae bacterium]
FESLPGPWDQIAFLLLVVAIVGVILFLVQRAWAAPWGRVLRAIRENEDAAEAAGKDVEKFRLQAFILGSALMGLFGALMAHYVKIISPEGTEPLLVTFLPWVMLIVGGAGNNKGAVLGAILVWGLWTMTELLTGRLPDEWALRVGYLRIFLIGLLLQVVLQKFPGGLLPERPPTVPRD